MNVKDIRKDQMFRYLAVLTIASVVSLQTWRTLFNNFAVEVAHLEGYHIGIIQSIREVPGFLALLAIFIIMVMRVINITITAGNFPTQFCWGPIELKGRIKYKI